jgi:hypothetical protein
MAVSEPNPYQSPLAEGLGALTLPLLPEHRWHELEIHVASVVRGWWRHRILLTGSIDALVEYDPRGNGERVYVNHQLLVTTSVWGWHLVEPCIDFFLEAFEHLVPARIHVRASLLLLLRTTAFRLEVAGRTVYED